MAACIHCGGDEQRHAYSAYLLPDGVTEQHWWVSHDDPTCRWQYPTQALAFTQMK